MRVLRWLAIHFLVACFLFFAHGILKQAYYKQGLATKKCTFANCTKYVVACELRK